MPEVKERNDEVELLAARIRKWHLEYYYAHDEDPPDLPVRDYIEVARVALEFCEEREERILDAAQGLLELVEGKEVASLARVATVTSILREALKRRQRDGE